jgi:segregation and condensation protein A
VIAVIDGFLDQLRQRFQLPRVVSGRGGSYEQDLAESSEVFLAASVLVSLKAEVLESSTFPSEPDGYDSDPANEDDEDGWLATGPEVPSRPERHLLRRPVAPPPLARSVTLGELIQQLEDIAERLERHGAGVRHRSQPRRLSDRAAIAQVSGLAHREKLPETTAALSRFLHTWSSVQSSRWVDFDDLVDAWAAAAPKLEPAEDLDRDRVGVFWALLFLCSQGEVELSQSDGLFGPLRLRRHGCQGDQPAPLRPPEGGSAPAPALRLLAA